MTPEVAAVAISGLSLVVSIVAIGANLRLTRKQTALTEEQTRLSAQIAETEAARRSDEILRQQTAALVVRIETERYQDDMFGRSHTRFDRYLVVQNIGAAPAKEITLDVESGAPPRRLDLSRFQGAYLDPNQDIKKLVFVALGERGTFVIRLGWTDERGRHEKSVPLSFT